MNKVIKFLVLSILVFSFAIPAIQQQQQQQSKLLLSVYYESLCPDSSNFIVNQLVPVMEELSKLVQLNLVPFGKAKSINYGAGGFQCQHGPSECYGNMIQDCTLNLMADRSDLDKLYYVACEMSTKAGSRNDFTCVRKAGVPEQLVQQCIQTGRGTQLQLNSEYETQRVSGAPWPNFIPTVTINSMFDQDFQNYAMTDLMGILCTKLQENQPCASRNNQIAINYLFRSGRLQQPKTNSTSRYNKNIHQ